MPDRSHPPSCYDKAVELLALRPHFRRQLEDKLRQRGYADAEVEEALRRLEGQGYLDDRRLAREVAGQRAGRGGEGSRRVRAELLKRGAAPEAVDAAVEEVLPADDTPAAAEAARRWQARGKRDPAALARHLDRKGFSQRAILHVLRGLGAEPADDEA